MYPTEEEYFSAELEENFIAYRNYCTKLDKAIAADIELHRDYLERRAEADRVWEEYVKESRNAKY